MPASLSLFISVLHHSSNMLISVEMQYLLLNFSLRLLLVLLKFGYMHVHTCTHTYTEPCLNRYLCTVCVYRLQGTLFPFFLWFSSMHRFCRTVAASCKWWMNRTALLEVELKSCEDMDILCHILYMTIIGVSYDYLLRLNSSVIWPEKFDSELKRVTARIPMWLKRISFPKICSSWT